MIFKRKNLKIGVRTLLFAVVGGIVLMLQTAAVLAQGQSVTFGWEADPDPGIAGYNIYYGTASQAYTNKVSFGNVTTATVSGLSPVVTYYFAASTYDVLNQESALSPEIVYTVPEVISQSPPAITTISISNSIVTGQRLGFFINATGTGPLTFTLAPGAPSGAWINATNGFFHWSPGIYQASTTDAISVIVTDGGTGLSSTQSFSVVIQDNVSLFPGTVIVATNSIGSLPVSVFASTPVTNLMFTMTYPSGQLTNLSFSSVNPSVGLASISPGAPGQALISIAATSGQSLTGLQSLGSIGFTSRNDSKTSIAYVQIVANGALKTDGTTVSQELGGLGRVTIVGQDAMLEGQSTNGVRNLVLYAPVGVGYVIQSCNSPGASSAWADTAASVTMNGLSQNFQFLEDGSSAAFYRTRRTQ
jgi:hypothetical protein